MEKEFNIHELKQAYEKFAEKYSLPDFSDMNRVFDIEEIDDGEFLLRKIRRTISEKIAGYLRFVEIVLNPANAPMFFFKLVKKLDVSDRVVLTEIYEELGMFEIEAVKLDLDYDEKIEAEFIKKCYNVFCSDVKNKLFGIIKKLENCSSNKSHETEGSYFG